MAGWNVCAHRRKDAVRVAGLGGDDVDDCLGCARLHLCAVRNVEAPSRPGCQHKSARPEIGASENHSEKNGSIVFTHNARLSTSLSVTVICWVAPSIETYPKNCRPKHGARFSPCEALAAL